MRECFDHSTLTPDIRGETKFLALAVWMSLSVFLPNYTEMDNFMQGNFTDRIRDMIWIRCRTAVFENVT